MPRENPSATRNHAPIEAVIGRIVRPGERIVEIGAGNAQHAALTISRLPVASWQVTDVTGSVERLRDWLDWAGDSRLAPPLPYTAGVDRLDFSVYTLALAINVAHIMSWPEFAAFLADAASLPAGDGRVVCYGPFRVHGRHTSEGNADFDRSLRNSCEGRGLRDIDDLDTLARDCGFERERWFAMPANNQLLVYRRL